MAKRLKVTKSKNSESFFVIDDYINPISKKRSTFVVERLGSLSYLLELYNTDSRDIVLDNLLNHVDELRAKDKEDKSIISISLSPAKLIPIDNQCLFNLGYLYPRNILNSLGISNICKDLSSNYKFQFDLQKIICDLVSARIVFPGSKLSSFNDASHFLEAPTYKLEDIYRSLPILANNRYFFESELYKNSSTLFSRNTNILYYDCTNFYFETEEEDDYRMYGKSKENRPNPIVQYGLFMDSDGIPIADICFEGNKNEQFSMRKLEKQIEGDFQFSKFIVCADAGLNGWENKIFNDKKDNGAFIVTQPIKKLKKNLKEWAINPNGWKIIGHPGIYNINNLEDTMTIEGKSFDTSSITFYKDRWEPTTKKQEDTNIKYTLEEHIIVTFSTKFKKYQKHIREKKLERARKLLNNPGKISTNNPRDPKYYIKKIPITKAGEVATENEYLIDEKKVEEDEKYDGFYAVTTDLEDGDIGLIIKANKQRWEIEENFEIMKSELKTRPMYVTRKEAIEGHLLICFMALLVYRILEKKYCKEEYTCVELINTLRDMNITHVNGSNYVPSFKRTDITDKLAEIFGFQPAREVLTQSYLKKFTRVVNSRKSTKLK